MERLISLEKEQIAAIIDGPPTIDEEDTVCVKTDEMNGGDLSVSAVSTRSQHGEAGYEKPDASVNIDDEDSFASVSGEQQEDTSPADDDTKEVALVATEKQLLSTIEDALQLIEDYDKKGHLVDDTREEPSSGDSFLSGDEDSTSNLDVEKGR